MTDLYIGEADPRLVIISLMCILLLKVNEVSIDVSSDSLTGTWSFLPYLFSENNRLSSLRSLVKATDHDIKFRD